MGDTPRQTLSTNLTRLMEQSPDYKTVKQLHVVCPGVSTGTIDRIRRGVVATSVDALAELAAAFDLEPWQMLIPGIRAGDKAAPTTDTINAARALLRYAVAIEKSAVRHDGRQPVVKDESTPAEGFIGGSSNFGDLDEAEDKSTPPRKSQK